MRRVLVTLLVPALLASAGHAATARRDFDRLVPVGPGATLRLTNMNGRVSIRGWNERHVRVRAVEEVNAHDEQTARLVLQRCDVDVTAENDEIVVRTAAPPGEKGASATVVYEIDVPRAITLRVRTLNGRVEIADVDGKLDVQTTNGRIVAVRCSGSVDARSRSGAIAVELRRVTAGQPLRLATVNGAVSLALPSTVSASIDAATSNGIVTTNLPVAVAARGRRSLRGTLNGGGPLVHLRTSNGSIAVRKL